MRIVAYEIPGADACALCGRKRVDLAVTVDDGVRVAFGAHRECFVLLTGAVIADAAERKREPVSPQLQLFACEMLA